MTDLTLDEINRLRALEKAATPGPYYVDGGRNMHGRIYCGWTLKARHPDFVEDGAGYQIASIGGTGHPDADAERLCALANAAPALLDMAAECLRLRYLVGPQDCHEDGCTSRPVVGIRTTSKVGGWLWDEIDGGWLWDEIDELLRELDGAGFELESRAAATIRKPREELASLETDALEAGSRASKIISRLCAERDRLAAEVEKLREERDAARHNSFTESADRDRLAAEVEKWRGLHAEAHRTLNARCTELADAIDDRDRIAERVRELEQELDAARKTPVKALEAENEALWRILRELDSDGTMEERAKLRTDREALRTAVEIRDRKNETT